MVDSMADSVIDSIAESTRVVAENTDPLGADGGMLS
jgi:hypothetical protein